ncbi:hypothetical protein Pla108_15400 [Botrimarina colliarenosi]|uniref:Uncharacterized protein n=1 Tax=Botrimarina colliarenosi TaxID=2528001 RepID=A0A5C6AM73_9BACT|nr:hypothetical protein [Botrimarina colliarenosi]TWU00588.1 hypothetical protein Pla108_15400 [Botrimarina colliarenosi]
MTKHLMAAAAAVALCFVAGADKAEARGFHIRAGGVHVDVGNPHGHGRGYAVGYPAAYGYGGFGGHGGGYGGVHRSFYGGGHGGHHGGAVWHDTTHYDWHGPSLRRHGNHYDYTPGHYDLHRDGHWDRH